MASVSRRSATECVILFFLAFAILWKGGKALDATWMLAMLACGVTFWDMFFISRKEKTFASPFLWTLALTFLMWTTLSFAFSATRNYGLDEVMQAASLYLLFSFALTVPEKSVAVFQLRLARLVSATTLVACGIGILVYTRQPVNRFVGTFFDFRFTTDYWPNAWAQFLLLAWPMLLWSLWGRIEKGGDRKKDLIRSSVLGLVLGCLLLSYSRGGLLAFALQIGLLGMFALWKWRKELPLKRILAIAVTTVIFSVWIFLGVNRWRSHFYEVQSVAAKVTFSADEGTSSVSERAAFWRQATFLAQERPMFGFGPYSFRFVQPHLQDAVLATSDHPHNVFLKFAMERGVPAAILFTLIVLMCMYAGMKSALQEKNSRRSALTGLLVLSVVGVTVHSFIDYNLQFVAIALPYWLMLGLLASRGGNEAVRMDDARRIFSALIAILLLAIALNEGRFLILSSQARVAERAGDFPEALKQYARTDRSIFPRDAWLSRTVMLAHSGTPAAVQNAIDHAMALNDQDYRIWKLQGDLFIKLHKTADAKKAFEKAYAFGRYNDLGITRVLVELHSTDRKTLDARRHEFDLLLDDFALAIEENTHFIALSSNVEELVKLCDIFAILYPADADAYRSLSRRSAIHAGVERSRIAGRPHGLLW